MSDTPRTDAATKYMFEGDYRDFEVVTLEFAEQLERELQAGIDEVRAQRDALGFNRPYDCYWSRRALDAERVLRLIQSQYSGAGGATADLRIVKSLANRYLERFPAGNDASGETKGPTPMKRTLLLNADGADGNGPADTAGQTTSPTPAAERSRPTSIVAKMSSWNEPTRIGNSEQIQLNAVYAEAGVNKAWATSTPSGQLTLSIDNPDAQGFFAKGKEYIVTIREAQPGE